MRMVKAVRALWTLGIAAMTLLPFTGVASANYVTDLSTERSGSVLVFPKVIWDGTRDTIIRVANTSNSMVHVHCFYVNGAQSCGETDFDFFLTKQHPTHWTASMGRSYSDAGILAGRIPPAPMGFVGEVKCIQVDLSGVPTRGNALKGDAVLRSSNGDVSEYNALAFQGNSVLTTSDPNSTGPGDLVYDLTPAHASGMYSSCPATLLLNHMAENQSPGSPPGAPSLDPISGLPLNTELTLVPCNEDLENQISSKVVVQFAIRDEFERAYSTSTTVSCFMNEPLGKIGGPGLNPFTYGVLGTATAYTRITPAPDSGGVIGVAEEFRGGTITPSGLQGGRGAAAFNLQMEGNRYDPTTDADGNPVPGKTDHLIVPLPF
jgi:hypothetical protein